jgi:hypothetical protein
MQEKLLKYIKIFDEKPFQECGKIYVKKNRVKTGEKLTKFHSLS